MVNYQKKKKKKESCQLAKSLKFIDTVNNTCKWNHSSPILLSKLSVIMNSTLQYCLRGSINENACSHEGH